MQTIIILKVIIDHNETTTKDLDDSCAFILGQTHDETKTGLASYEGVQQVVVEPVLIRVHPSRLS